MKKPPDDAQRRLIAEDLDRTLLVEAAAGTGKTTMLIRRMLALLVADKCQADTLAAVTFTRKAAADIRARFQIALERELHASEGSARERLELALENIDRCFIGTIHSFCARLLRERPMEAGVDIGFAEIDEDADLRLRRRAWHEYIDSLFAHDEKILQELENVNLQLAGSSKRYDPLLAKLDELGLEIIQLGPTFIRLAEFPDVEQWPAPVTELPELPPLAEKLCSYIAHIRDLLPKLPDLRNSERLVPVWRQIDRMATVMNLNKPAELMEILERFREFELCDLVQKNWPGGKQTAVVELERWNDFYRTCAKPAVTKWREHRYEIIMRTILPALRVYDRLRRESNALNFQDLLLKSVHLLRDKPQVREYFRARFTHLLVDEFQDTDPIQAEIMFLLTADDPHETDWRRCRPRPGSLFVVGDPKQSIYRFRRADILAYRQVKDIVEHCGAVVPLSANFRSTPSHIQWVNTCFGDVFPDIATDQMPARCDLQVGRDHTRKADLVGLHHITAPASMKVNEIVAEEAATIAGSIRKALDEGWTVPRASVDEDPRVRPSDFLIITWGRRFLSTYGQELQKLNIPHQVTGGSSVNQVPELQLLYILLRAATRPDDEIALLAVLRSELFGLSDQALYTYREAGGKFSLHAPPPEELEPELASNFLDVMQRLRQYAHWLRQLPAATAVERIIADLGLAVRACISTDGATQAGGLMKAVELLRAAREDAWSPAELVDYLEQLVEQGESHDAVPIRPDDTSPVRIMNLHKAKGLEAPIVFLVDPTGRHEHPVELHIDRSGEHARGYLAVYGQKRGYGDAPLLAHPHGWDELEKRERQFLEAENLRLMYVAATRAGSQLIISSRAPGKSKDNPWWFFETRIQNPEHGFQALPQVCIAPVLSEPMSLRDSEPIETSRAIQQRWCHAQTATYEVVTAKTLALPNQPKPHGTGEHAAQWGTIIHSLLEAATSQPDRDREPLARSLLEDQGLDSTLLDDVLQTVDAVTQSELWIRVQASSRRLVEIPFATELDGTLHDGPASTLPTILRGVIDLAFWENDAWVIVDYKTEQITPPQVASLAEYYRGQVELYANYWEKLTGERVGETGLFFTHLQRYEELR